MATKYEENMKKTGFEGLDMAAIRHQLRWSKNFVCHVEKNKNRSQTN